MSTLSSSAESYTNRRSLLPDDFTSLIAKSSQSAADHPSPQNSSLISALVSGDDHPALIDRNDRGGGGLRDYADPHIKAGHGVNYRVA